MGNDCVGTPLLQLTSRAHALTLPKLLSGRLPLIRHYYTLAPFHKRFLHSRSSNSLSFSFFFCITLSLPPAPHILFKVPFLFES